MHTVSNLSANSCTAAIMPCAWGILVDGLLICPGYIPRNLSANFLHKLYESRSLDTSNSEAWLVFNMKMSSNYKMLCDCEVSKNITRRPGHQSDSNGGNADGIPPLCLSPGHSQADKFC